MKKFDQNYLPISLLLFLQLRDAEKRYQNKENELLSYKEQQMSKPEVKLEAELSLLRVEKVGV